MTTQVEHNARMWRSARLVSSYANAALEPAEALILARNRETLSGRVLDIGCGAGRVLAYLVLLGADAHGVDISPRMVEHCRRLFPGVDVRVGDLSQLSDTVEGPFDALLMTDSLLDVYDDRQRRLVLADLRKLLSRGGLLVFSSHNLAHWEGRTSAPPESGGARAARVAGLLARASAGQLLRRAQHAPRIWRNRRRLGPLQYREHDHAVINDPAHEYGLLHYYIGRQAQERQLMDLGYEVIDVLELSGPSVPPGEEGRGPALYYVATAAT